MARNNNVRAEATGSSVELLESLIRPDDMTNAPAAALSGHLAGIDDEGRILFRADTKEECFPVSIGVSLSDDELVKAAWLGQRALAVRTADETPRFVLVALLRERVTSAAKDAVRNGVNVKVDGEDVRLTGKREIELRCGKARLLLRKDGRIEISGTSITTRSRGAVRIKGATIALN